MVHPIKPVKLQEHLIRIIIRRKKNKGYGIAIQTGLEFCRQNHYDIAIILDADG
ncbi:MAG: hypothetical protein ACTSQS_15595 [Promethearchaeota archaeon]